MKKDRFLTGILVAIAALVVIALIMFFSRQGQQQYMDENSPEGVVHNYTLAVLRGEYERAYAYLAEDQYKPSYAVFRQAFIYNSVGPDNASLEIGETEIVGQQAFVTVSLLYNPSDPFSSSYRSNEIARLELQNGDWRLLQMPYNFWAYDWYQPTPKPVQ